MEGFHHAHWAKNHRSRRHRWHRLSGSAKRMRLSRAYLTGMKTRGWGRIIFISSESGVKIPHEMIHYGVSKAAQIAVARGIAESTPRDRGHG
jgi:NAD(P)-dependent dehydrogenase (short-subunit alcohol dehydrogenase family)